MTRLQRTDLRVKVLESLDGLPLTIDEVCRHVAPTLPFQSRPARDMTERAIRELYQAGLLYRGLRSEFQRLNPPEKGRLYALTEHGRAVLANWTTEQADLFTNVVPFRRRES